MINVPFKKLNERAMAPVMAKTGDACLDIFATGFSWNGSVIVVDTGLAFEVPDGYELQVRCRSGFAAKGVFVTNGLGTVDSGYRGEVKVFLSAVGTTPFLNPGGKSVKIGTMELSIGDRVAQIAVRPVPEVAFEEVEELGDSDRGTGGFGSTGIEAIPPAEPVEAPVAAKNPLRKK